MGSLGQKLPSKPRFGMPLLLPVSTPGRVCTNVECFFRGSGKPPGASLGLEWKANTPELCLAKNSGHNLTLSLSIVTLSFWGQKPWEGVTG